MIVEAGESQLCRGVDQEAGDQGRVSVAPECDGSLLAECLLTWWKSVFILLSSVNGVSRAHIMEGNVLYVESTDLNATLIYKIPSQQYLDMYDEYLSTVASPGRHIR